MRDIDARTRACVNYFESGCFGNTMVVASENKGIVSVYLHTNFIYERGRDYEVFTLHGWNTNVTRNRLNACLYPFRIIQKDFKPYLVGRNDEKKEIDSDKFYKFKGGKWFVLDSLDGEYEPLNW